MKSNRNIVKLLLRDICIFCDNARTAHEVTTLIVDKHIKSMATEMSDGELLVKISGGDLIVLEETQYHFNCLTIHYSTFSTQNASRQASKQARGRAFSEVVVFPHKML